MGKLFLTFDCEDFINPRSTVALYSILKLLDKYNLRGIFFLTGHVCQKLTDFPKILELLEKHEIGYHGSSHSVHPTICEYTDVDDYDTAVRISLERETAQINPLTGVKEGKGGFLLLRYLFPNNQILSFRAPGFCWSPPHLEALQKLGIKFDFSAKISSAPVCYRNITFYPYPIGAHKHDSLTYVRAVYKSLLPYCYAVLLKHPHNLVNRYWDSIYYNGNPKRLCMVNLKSPKETRNLLRSYELFFKRISSLSERGFIEVTPPLQEGSEIRFTKKQVLRCYRESIKWVSRFGYKPKFILRHFTEYFNIKLDAEKLAA